MTSTTIDQALVMAGEQLQSGRLREVETICRGILTEHPDNADALNFLAVALSQTGRAVEALQVMRKAVALHPIPNFQNNLGVMLTKLDQTDEAIGVFNDAILQRPDYAEAYNNLGNALKQNRQLDQAIAAYRKAVELRWDYFQAYSNMGFVLSMQREFGEAIDACRKSLSLQPNYAQAYVNLGMALEGNGQLDEAIAASRKALELQPELPEAYLNLSKAYSEKGQLDEAIAAARRAVSLRPTFGSGHFNLGTILLMQGNYHEGWRQYEYRIDAEHLQLTHRDFSQPRWDGSNLTGRRILLHTEQGFGDAIQFVRYVDRVARLGGEIILECHPELHRLFRHLKCVKQLVVIGEPFPHHDVQYPLISLPYLFDTTLETIPSGAPYLEADPIEIRKWATRTGNEDGLKVGLAWAGKPVPEPDRSVPLSQFSPLATIAGLRFYTLQKGNAGRQTPPPGMELIDWTMELNDFADTAALIANLDLVITIDSAIAHLAGAMGKPTWLLLRFAADWRWLKGRDDSPWYPTMRLFRQPIRGDWDTPMRQIQRELKSRVQR